MERVTYRRTLNINDFESLSMEVTVEHEDLNTARLLAAQKYLILTQQELIRIYGIKSTTFNPWDRVNLELNGITTELEQLRRK